MTLQERIQTDMKTSMINKDTDRLSLLRVIKGEINREAKELPDEKVLVIIKKMKENALMMGNQSEVVILDEYLPVTLGLKQTETLITGIITKNNYNGIKDMGKVMVELKAYGSQVDGKLASSITKTLLSQ